MYKFAPLLLAALAAAAPSLPETCTNLPAGFCGGAMVPNVAYNVPAMYDCAATKCKEMNIWCQADKDGKAYEYLYCCGDNCEGFPKEKTCKVEGKEYIVGQAYESVTLKNGDCVTLWCLDEKEYRTCGGKKDEACGCKPELTPPPPQVCKKTADPCPTCPKPQPKPPVKPECTKDKDCGVGNYCDMGKCYPARTCYNLCPAGYEKDPVTCECFIPEDRTCFNLCPAGYEKNPVTCECFIPEDRTCFNLCPDGQLQNPTTCECFFAPDSTTCYNLCPPGTTKDPVTCECLTGDFPTTCFNVCPSGTFKDPVTCECLQEKKECFNVCPDGLTKDPITCECL